jgi:hypothetical protein
MAFKTIVVIIATIFLIAALTFIGYSLYKHQYKSKFPPLIGQCPDYWVANDKNECENPKSLGKSTCHDAKSFDNPHFKGHNGNCNKYNWARQCKVSWDGITNNPDICKKHK